MIKKSILNGFIAGVIVIILVIALIVVLRPKDEVETINRFGYYEQPINISSEFVEYYNDLGFNGIALKNQIENLESLDNNGCIKISAISLFNTLNSVRLNPNGSRSVKKSDVECLIIPLTNINLFKLMDYTKYKTKITIDIENEFLSFLHDTHLQYCSKNNIRISELLQGIYTPCCWDKESICRGNPFIDERNDDPYTSYVSEKNQTKSQYDEVRTYEINYDCLIQYCLLAFILTFITISTLYYFILKSKSQNNIKQ